LFNILQITPAIVDDFPNNYTYTKSLAEVVVLNDAKELPTAIVRPSIGKLIKNLLTNSINFKHFESDIEHKGTVAWIY
jgi:Male sterility protein